MHSSVVCMQTPHSPLLHRWSNKKQETAPVHANSTDMVEEGVCGGGSFQEWAAKIKSNCIGMCAHSLYWLEGGGARSRAILTCLLACAMYPRRHHLHR